MDKEMGNRVEGIQCFWNYEEKKNKPKKPKNNLLLYVDKSLLKFQVLLNM